MTQPTKSEPEEQAQIQPLVAHLVELRRRLFWVFLAMLVGTGLCWLVREPIYGFLVRPLADAFATGNEAGSSLPLSQGRLIYTGLTEAFFTYLRVSFFAGCFLTFPFLLMQIWLFLAPALYKKERRVLLPYLVATPFLFFIGGALVYYGVIPLAWRFFLSFESTGGDTVLPIHLEARVSEYLDLVMTLVFAFGLCFQLPVLLTLLARVGVVSSAFLKGARKYAIVVIFTVAAFLTPPDVFSQTALALPILGLYELSIFLVRRIEKARDVPNPQ